MSTDASQPALVKWLEQHHGKPQFGELLYTVLLHAVRWVLVPIRSEWNDDRQTFQMLAGMAEILPEESMLARTALEGPGSLEPMEKSVLDLCARKEALRDKLAQALHTGWKPQGMEESVLVGGQRHRDLRGVKCPINSVKAKLELARMVAGETLKLWLDHGSPIENVPRSLVEEGHAILSRSRREDGSWELIVRKS